MQRQQQAQWQVAGAVLEFDWARRVVAADEAAAGVAVQVDGRMVDLPVVLQARQTLARAAMEVTQKS